MELIESEILITAGEYCSLPGPEVLFEPGKADGQTKLVRKGTSVKCYSWSAATQTWSEVGDVMGAAGATEGKTMYEGKVRKIDFIKCHLVILCL